MLIFTICTLKNKHYTSKTAAPPREIEPHAGHIKSSLQICFKHVKCQMHTHTSVHEIYDYIYIIYEPVVPDQNKTLTKNKWNEWMFSKRRLKWNTEKKKLHSG